MLKNDSMEVKVIVAQCVSNTVQIVHGQTLQTMFTTLAFPVHLRSVYLWQLPDKLSYQQYNQHCACDQVAVVGSSTGIAHIFPIPSKTSGIVDIMTLQVRSLT